MNLYNNIRRSTLLVFVSLYLLNSIIGVQYIFYFNSVLLIVIVGLTLPIIPFANRIVAAALMLIGTVIFLVHDTSLTELVSAFSRNADMAALFITLPLISLPFFYENYQEELKNIAQKYMTSPWPLCVLTAMITNIFGAIILMGSIPLVFHLLNKNAKLYKAEKHFIAAMLQGQIASGFWSPVWASMIIITYSLNIPWLRFLPYGLFLTLIYFIFYLFWSYVSLEKSNTAISIQADKSVNINWKKIFTIVLLTLNPIFLIIIFIYFTSLKITAIIPLIALSYPLLAAMVQNKWRQYAAGLISYYNTDILSVKNEIVLLPAAGFFGKSLEIAGVDSAILYFLPEFAVNYPFFSILFIMAVFIIISLVGIHPIVVGSSLVISISPASIGLTPLIYGLALLVGWALAILLSPFSAVSLITSNLTNISSWKISLGINGLFGFSAALLMAGILTIMLNIL